MKTNIIKYILTSVLIVFSISTTVAEGYDKERFDNGLEQIGNSNRNYFRNQGWIEESWYVLSNWYPDVLLLDNADKYKIAKVINSDEVISKFEALNAKKKSEGVISLREIENFNVFLWEKLESEVSKIYGKSSKSK